MDPEQALLKGTGGKPGVDHIQHPQEMKEEVARNTGGNIASVTPPEEAADEVVKTQTSEFLAAVAPTGSEQTAKQSKSESSSGFGDFMEEVQAYIPGGGDTDRTTPSEGLAKLESERREKMTEVS